VTIRAIDTEYAGHLFRSRLEARWAYVFDLMKIRWEYEPEGFEVNARLTDPSCDTRFRYLPDFWLPDLKVWAEVKGTLRSEVELLKLVDAAAGLSCSHDGCGYESGGHDTILFGPMTADFTPPLRMHMHDQHLLVRAWNLRSPLRSMCEGDPIAWSAGGPWSTMAMWISKDWRAASRILLSDRGKLPDCELRSAMQQAIKARFDHGLTPDRPL
jgi:hypothetical protein